MKLQMLAARVLNEGARDSGTEMFDLPMILKRRSAK
jgi:hypothetical protein